MWRAALVIAVAMLTASVARAQNAFPLIGVGGQPSSLVEGGAARGLSTPEPFQVQSLKIQGINGVAQLLQVDKNGNVTGTGNLGSGGGGGSGNLVVGTTTITNGSNGAVEFNNNGILGELGVSGTGVVVENQSPTIHNLTLSGPLSGAGVINSANLANGTALANIGGGAITNVYLAPGAALGNIGTGNITSAYLAPGAAQGNITAGSIANLQLANSSVTIGGSTLALGGTVGNAIGSPITGTLFVTGLNISGTCTGCAGSATSIAVGTTNITGGTSGNLEFNNNGKLGEQPPTFTFGGSTITLGGAFADSPSPIAGTTYLTNLTLNGSGFSIGGNAITFPGTAATLAALNLPETFAAAQSFGEVHGTAYQPTLSSNNYNAAITDCGKTLLLPTGSSPTVTMPNVNPTSGECTVKMVQMTSAAYTIDAASGGAIVSGSTCTGITTARQYAQIVATLIVPSGSAATWDIAGDCQ